MKKKLLSYLATVTIFLSLGGYFFSPYLTYSTQEVVVNRVESKNDMYLVYTDKGVFKNEDTWYYFKFDSSDLYNELSKEGKFSCGTYGFRVGFFSMYPNLTDCTQ